MMLLNNYRSEKNVQARELILYLRKEAVSFPLSTKINIQTDKRSKDSKRRGPSFLYFLSIHNFPEIICRLIVLSQVQFFFLSDTVSSLKSLIKGKYV